MFSVCNGYCLESWRDWKGSRKSFKYKTVYKKILLEINNLSGKDNWEKFPKNNLNVALYVLNDKYMKTCQTSISRYNSTHKIKSPFYHYWGWRGPKGLPLPVFFLQLLQM